MLQTVEVYFLVFLSYSFLGWFLEVVAKYFEYGRFINRGFLIGPYCPIYGWAGLIMTLLLTSYADNPLLLFILGMLVSALLEYGTSWAMEKIFHARWWDYSTKKFNINGRICLDTLIPFGLMCLLAINFVNPILFGFYQGLSALTLHILAGVLAVIFLTDTIISTFILGTFRRENRVLDQDNTEEMSAKVRARLQERGLLQRRLLRAFPGVHHIGIILKDASDKAAKRIQKSHAELTKRQREIIRQNEENIARVKAEYDYKIAALRRQADRKVAKKGKK